MLLTAALFDELSKLMQIILWIILPLLLFSALVTVLIHYGRKWNKNDNEEEGEVQIDIAGSSPDNFCYRTEEGKFVYLDHTGLLREFRKKLLYSHARYAALKQDFRKLKSGNAGFIPDTANCLPDYKNSNMENIVNSSFACLQGDDSLVSDKDSIAENELSPGSNASEQAGPEENSSTNFLQEDSELKNQTQDQAWFSDLLDEKKKQIEFLQNQIDIRVKKYHSSEQERAALRAELEFFRNSLTEKDALLNANQQMRKQEQDQTIYLENLLKETKEQNQLLNAVIADSQDKNEALLQQLQAEETRVIAMEKKLLANKQLLHRLYNEFAACLNEETDTSPVIALRPDYINMANVNSEWDETAVQ